jgi:hypothetical protein
VKRTLLILVLLLAGCQGIGSGQGQAAQTTTSATTTTVAPATTTKPDPAEEGCTTFRDDPSSAIELLLISRDDRIVAAAREYEAAEPPSGRWVRTIDELMHACIAAGYEP